MTIYENYLVKLKEADEKHKLLLEELKQEWIKETQNCDHKWIRGEDMFYVLGETYPGEKCTECGIQRRCK
jgi:hypothetical protein